MLLTRTVKEWKHCHDFYLELMDLLAVDWLRLGRDPNLGLPTSTEWLLTGALASLGVDEGAVLEEGVSNLK